MISETFYKEFEKTMNAVCGFQTDVNSEDYTYMIGILKGAELCNHISKDDFYQINSEFRYVPFEGHVRMYLKVVRDLMTKKQVED